MGRLVGSITLTALNTGTYISGELQATLPPVFYASKNLWSTADTNIIYPRFYGRGGEAFTGDKINLVYWKVDGVSIDTTSITNVEKTSYTVNGGNVPALSIRNSDIFGNKEQVLVEGRFIVHNANEDIQITRSLMLSKSNVVNEEFFTQIEVVDMDHQINTKDDKVKLKVHCYRNGNEVTIDGSTYKAQWFISTLDDLKENSSDDSNNDGLADKNWDGTKDGWAALRVVDGVARIDNNETADYYTEIVVDEPLVNGSSTFKVIVYDSANNELDDANTVIYDVTDDVLNLDCNTTQVGEGKPATIVAYCTSRYSVPNVNVAKKFKVKEWDISAFRTVFNNGYSTLTTPTNVGISVKNAESGSNVVAEENMIKYKHTAGTELCVFEVTNEVFGSGVNKSDSVVIQVDAHLL